jgi:predicted nucleotidyltransferase
MYGINEKVYNNIIRYFNENNKIEKVILFGSRAKGNYKNNSDIDLCIKCSSKVKGTIKEEIDEIIGIYSCDIVFFDHLNDEIKEQIERDGIEIFLNN